MDARRAADRARHPVLRVGLLRALPRRRRRRLHRRVRGRPHAQPVHALQRAHQVRRRCSRRRSRSASTPSATGHYAHIVDGCRGQPRAAPRVRRAKDQSYVLGVLTAEQLAHALLPARATPSKAQVRAEAAARGALRSRRSPTATTSASSPTATPAAGSPSGSATEPGEIVDRSRAPSSGRTRARTPSRSASAAASHLGRPAPDGKPRFVVSVDAPANRVVIGTADLLGVDLVEGRHLRWCGPAPTGEVRVGAQVRAHGAEVPRHRDGERGGGMPCAWSSTSGCGAWPRPVGRALRRHPGRRVGDDRRHRPRLSDEAGRRHVDAGRPVVADRSADDREGVHLPAP